MEIFTFMPVNIVAVLGLGIGIAQYYISPEEMKDGERYFVFLRNVIAAMLLFFLLEIFNLNIVLIIVLSLLVFFFFTYYKFDYLFLLFGAVLPFAASNKDVFYLESTLIFLSGFFIGSLFMHSKKNKFKKFAINAIGFLAISLLIFLIQS